MPIVEVVGVGEDEFPDSMTDEQIKQVLQQKFSKTAQPKQPGSSFINSTVDKYVEPFLQGATFGFADELGGLGARIGSWLADAPQERQDAAYGREVARRRNALADYRQESPVVSGGIELAGGLVSGAPVARLADLAITGAKGVNMLRQGASMATAGAVGGGLYGAGASEGDKLEDAGRGALVGGIAGPAVGLAGRKIADAVGKSKIMGAIGRTSPSKDDLAEASNRLYEQAKQSGIRLKSDQIGGLVGDMQKRLKTLGYHPDIHPKVSAALKSFQGSIDNEVDIGELDNLRRIMASAARSTDKDEARIATNLLGVIDDKLSSLSPRDVAAGDPRKVGQTLTEARSLWSRKRRLDMIEEAFEKASNQASGLENGLRVQFRSILNSAKKRRGFSADELDLMRKVVRGGTSENILKLLGKLGFSENQATQLLGTSIGIGAGAAAAGPAGAVAVPLVGQAAKNAAQRMTRNNVNQLAVSVARGVTPKALYQQIVKNPQQAAQLLGTADDATIQAVMEQARRAGDQQTIRAIGVALGVAGSREP